MGDIFREIDEELRHERFEKLWRSYGRYAIAAVVIVVVGVAGFSGWKQYDESRQLEDGARFAAAKALLGDGKKQDAQALLTALARESGTSYGMLARFHVAALQADSGNSAGAVRAYDALAADTGIDKPLRDLAALLSALAMANSPSGDAAAIAARLEPLAQPGSPWRHSAFEVLGMIAQRSGDGKKAREYYRRIVDDIAAPQGVRARASQMLAIIGD